MPSRHFHRAILVLAVATLGAGCSAHLQTRTVQLSDTYDLWAARLEHMPFVFHHPNGAVEAYDVHGTAWKGDIDTRRVEVFEGIDGALPTALCTTPDSTGTASQHVGTGEVTAAICDRQRTVVSFNESVRERVLASKPTYVPRVRHLLLEGIWESVAQEPAPLHT